MKFQKAKYSVLVSSHAPNSFFRININISKKDTVKPILIYTVSNKNGWHTKSCSQCFFFLYPSCKLRVNEGERAVR